MREERRRLSSHSLAGKGLLVIRFERAHCFLTSPPALHRLPRRSLLSTNVADLMSGQKVAENSSDSHKQPTDAQATPLGDDPTASLRAAALRTLKSKRRKPNIDQPSGLPARPLTARTPSVVLDYGQQDSSPNDSPVVLKPSTSVPEPQPMDVDDAHMREEGEISDSEAPPIPVPSKSLKDILPPVPRVSPKPLRYKRSPTPPRHLHHHPQAGSSTVLKSDPLSRPVPPESPQRLGSFTTPLAFPPDLSIYPVDENHVRPGLASMSAPFLPTMIPLNIVTSHSDTSTIRHCQRYRSRPSWLGCTSRTPR